MSDIESAIVVLEAWLNRLERRYIDAAAQAAERDAGSDAASEHDPAERLDRIAADMDRARKAIELWRKQAF
jgi:hypothetical protein